MHTKIMMFKGDYIENLKNKIQMEQLTHITLLSPETAKHLQVPIIMMPMMKIIMMMMITMTIIMMTIIMITIDIILFAQDLAQSKISDMNFTKFTAVLEKEITKIDLTSFIR